MEVVVGLIAVTVAAAGLKKLQCVISSRRYEQRQQCTLVHPIQVVTFDLHGVVFTFNFKLFTRTVRQIPLREGIYLLCHPNVIATLIGQAYLIARGRIPPEVALMNTRQRHPQLDRLVPPIIKVLNSQKPSRPVIALIKQLKKAGYQIHLLSNIGQKTLQELTKQFPQELALFDAVHHPNEHNRYAAKPSPIAYQHYLESKKLSASSVIFFDNRPENVRQALKHGMCSFVMNPKIASHWML